jgi:hypothetical protein
MKKYLITMLCLVLTCLLLAQEVTGFEDYLSHYKEIELPYDISLDSGWIIFPESSVIPEDYILKYICEPGKPCDDNPLKYWYRYGVQVKLGDYVGVILSKNCDEIGECTTEFGIGLVRYLLIVYSSEGEQISQIVLSRISDQHFGYVTFTENDNPCELLSISTKQGTLHEFIDYRNSIVQGVLDYYTYIIDRDGKIKGRKTHSSNIRVQRTTRKFNILEEWQ